MLSMSRFTLFFYVEEEKKTETIAFLCSLGIFILSLFFISEHVILNPIALLFFGVRQNIMTWLCSAGQSDVKG